MANAQDRINTQSNFVYGTGNKLGAASEIDRANWDPVRAYWDQRSQEAYNPLISGQGGYSPEEAAQIRRDQELQGLLPSEDSQGRNFLTWDEASDIRGNGESRKAYFNPEYTAGLAEEGGSRQRGAAGGLRTDIYGAIDKNALGLSGDYTGGTNATLTDTAGRVRGAVDPSRLRQDPGYAARVRMTDQQQQDIVTGAGISAGTGYRAAAGDVERQGRAAGVDPVGIAAMKEKLLRTGAGEAGDAMTMARIRASDAAAAREHDIETGRRAGETQTAQIQSADELALGNQGLSAQDRMEALRLGSAQDIGNRGMRAAEVSGNADIANERAIAGQQQQANVYNQNMGTELQTGIEKDAASRAQAIAQNRQGTELTNQNNVYNRGAAVNTEQSARAKAIADKRLADEQEGRGYMMQQQGIANQNVNAAAGRQQGVYGQEIGGGQGVVQSQATQDNQPKWWEKGIGAITGLAGAAGSVMSGINGIPKKPKLGNV